MRFFSLIRRLFQILKSQGTPLQIGVGVCFGMALGLTPLGGHSLVVFSLALTFNVSLGGVSVGFTVFKLLYFVLRPLSYALGYFVLETWGQLDAVWTYVFHWPVVAWMGLNQYLIFGGYLLSFSLGAAILPWIVWSVKRYRVGYGQRIAAERLQRLQQTWYGKAARWLLVGGEAKFQEVKARAFPFRIVRWQMLIGLPLIYGAIYVVSAYTVPFFAEQLVTRPAALVLGAEVNVAAARYDPLSGKISFNDFVVADPKNSGENLLVIGRASVDIGLVGLLQRRVLINRASLGAVQLHVKREADGSLNLDNVGTGWDVQGYLEWLEAHAGKVDWLGLLQKLWDYWRTRPPAPKPQPQSDLSGGHPLPLPHSWFAVERIGAERFELTLSDEYGQGTILPALRKAELVLENLEFSPKYARRPVSISLKGEFAEMPEASIELALRFEPQDEGKFRTTFRFGVQNVDLTRFAPLYEKTLPARLTQGTMTLAGTLTVAQNKLDGEAIIRLEALRITKKPDHPSLFGLDSISTDYMLQGINRFAQETPIEFAFNIGGTTEHPNFGWEAAFIDVAVQGLEMQANFLLRPFIELLKAKLQGLGIDRQLPELNAAGGLNALQDFLQELFSNTDD